MSDAKPVGIRPAAFLFLRRIMDEQTVKDSITYILKKHLTEEELQGQQEELDRVVEVLADLVSFSATLIAEEAVSQLKRAARSSSSGQARSAGAARPGLSSTPASAVPYEDDDIPF